MIDPRTDRISQLGAEIARLYRKVERLDEKCASLRQDRDGEWYFMLDLQRKTMRERALTLDQEAHSLKSSHAKDTDNDHSPGPGQDRASRR